MELRRIDIHSQLQFPQFDEDREAIIAEMAEEGTATITVGTDAKTSKEAVALAEKHPHLFATIGIHPTDADDDFDATEFASLITPKVVAAGECGLDYLRGMREDGQGDGRYKDRQRKIFIQQIEFAKAHGLPLMLHCRPSKGTMDAYEDALGILTGYPDVSGDFHFFVGDLATAKRALDAGFSVSFDGPITFTSDYDEVIRSIPEDRIMAETDAPFAAPMPHRGKRNSPLFIRYIIARMAEIRGVTEEHMNGVILANARRVFRLPL
jgi:TatD DNase family protein